MPVALSAAALPPPLPPASAPAIVAANASSGRVVIEWTPVAGATGYNVFRSTTGVWDPAPLVRVTSTRFTNTGLTNGTPYTYRVSAYNKGGSGPLSSIASATPMGTPTGVVATRGDRQVTLGWEAAAGAASYTVYRSLSSTSATFTPLAADIAGLTFVDTGLTNGTKYYYKVRAIAAGGVSALSATVSATPQPPPPATAPANLVAKPGNARVTLTWDPVAAATSYRVFRTTTGAWDPKPLATVTLPTFKNTGLVNGTAYSYKVLARNPGGDGPASDAVVATPVAPPLPPSGVTATASDHQVTLTWMPVSGATGYNVFRGTASN
ncbi:MAG: fibronectin type III domain-containing protein, partial [Vicinamibacterales bacterium]